MPTITQNDH